MTEAEPSAPMVAVPAAEAAWEPGDGCGEGDDAAGDRLDRVVGGDDDGQGVGEGDAVGGLLGRAAGDGGDGEAMALEGADVGRRVEGSPRWSVVIPATAVPAPMAGLPGRRAMVWVGPP